MATANAVFKGGGVKGIALVGALTAAEERGWTWQAVAGTSAGAITAALVAAGYTAQELKPILFGLDFNKFKDGGRLAILNLLRKEGIYKGQYVIDWLDELLMNKTRKAAPSFGDLEEQFGISLRVVATDITNMRELVFPDDLTDYGFVDPKSFPVAEAVRASMSIPYFFQPYVLKCPGGKTATLVDGGVLSNFPVSLFAPGAGGAQVPTLGYYLKAPDDKDALPTESLEQITHALITTILEGHDRDERMHQQYERSIDIPTGSVGTTDFDLTEAQKEWLFDSGYQAAGAFFADSDVMAWLSRFPATGAAAAEVAAGSEPK
ncbi:MAG TPA: patatin-like phospholipase family protein [Symbiobacteriaceae bacterium]|nr:patatin-like phospholipase family protein [Symbiobacteriaceae bacterium]